MPEPRVEEKLRRQIQELIAEGLTENQIFNRLRLVTFGSTTSKELADLILDELSKVPEISPLVEAPQALIDAVQNLIDLGFLTQEEADKNLQRYITEETIKLGKRDVFDPNIMETMGFSGEIQDFVNAWTSPDDLADRLASITGITPEAQQEILRNIIAGETAAAVGRRPEVAMRATAERARQVAEKTQLTERQALSKQLQGIAPRLQQFMNAPGLTAEERAFFTRQIGTPPTESVAAVEAHLNRLAEDRAKEQEVGLGRKLTSSERASLVSPEERQQAMGQLTLSGQTLRDYLDQVNEFAQRREALARKVVSPFNIPEGGTFNPFGGEDERERLRAISKAEAFGQAEPGAPAPLTRGDLEAAMNQFGFAPGTRLRSFIESEATPIVSELEEQRQAFWRDTLTRRGMPRKRQRESERESLLRSKARLEGQIPGLPTQEVIGNTYWGPGGPAEVARRAYEQVLSRLGEMDEQTRRIAAGEIVGDIPSEEPEELPEGEGISRVSPRRFNIRELLRARLAGRDFLSEFNRLPGVGISARLAPAVRFRR